MYGTCLRILSVYAWLAPSQLVCARVFADHAPGILRQLVAGHHVWEVDVAYQQDALAVLKHIMDRPDIPDMAVAVELIALLYAKLLFPDKSNAHIVRTFAARKDLTRARTSSAVLCTC